VPTIFQCIEDEKAELSRLNLILNISTNGGNIGKALHEIVALVMISGARPDREQTISESVLQAIVRIGIPPVHKIASRQKHIRTWHHG
jgi:hypothetical protein